MLPTRRYGNYQTSAQSGRGVISAGNARAVVYDAANYDIWIQSVSLIGNSAEASLGSFRAAIYALDDDFVPIFRLGYTQTVNLTGTMSAPGVGHAVHTAAVMFVDTVDGFDFTAIRVQAGQKYAIDIEAIGQDLAYSYAPGTRLAYSRAAPGNPQPETFTSYVSATHGLMTCYATGLENEKPRKPTNLSPDGDVFLDSLVFSADFQDLNGAYGTSSGDGVDTGDVLSWYEIEAVLAGPLGATIWQNRYISHTTEMDTNQVYRVYGGASLSPDTDFEWRIRCADELGEWSEWSDWTQVHISTAGIIVLDEDPQSTIQSIVPSFYGRWSHTALEAMTQVKIRLLHPVTHRVLYNSPVINKAAVSSAYPGTLFEITWAETTFPDLTWAKTYKYQMSGKDTSGVWSDWSNRRQFKTNAAPTIPSNLSPNNDVVFGTFPTLACSFADADDTIATGLTGRALIIRPDLSTVFVTLVYNALTSKWEKTLTGVEVSMTGTYFWSAYSFDGTLYSGEATILGEAQYSQVASFRYLSGPTCVVSTPTNGDVLTSSSIPVAWTSSGFTDYEVVLYKAGTTTVVYSTGVISEGSTQTSGSVTIPSGYVLNGESYDLIVYLTSFVGLDGSSPIISLSVDYVQPAALTNVVLTPISIASDIHDTAFRLTWDTTIYGDDEDQTFQEYIIYHRTAKDYVSPPKVFAKLSNAAASAVIDYLPAANVEHEYGICVVVKTGVDILQSEIVFAYGTLQWEETVLVSISDPGERRAILTGVRERSEEIQNSRTTYQSLSNDAPTTVRSASRYKTLPIAAKIVGDVVKTAVERKEELDLLDAALDTVCMRWANGDKFFIDMQNLRITHEHGGFFSVVFTGIEQAVTEASS